MSLATILGTVFSLMEEGKFIDLVRKEIIKNAEG